ncbi:unnamed protein product, partial [marine sediment metagenome]
PDPFFKSKSQFSEVVQAFPSISEVLGIVKDVWEKPNFGSNELSWQ